MDQTNWPFELALFGEELFEGSTGKIQKVGEQHFFKTLGDAFKMMLTREFSEFDPHLPISGGRHERMDVCRISGGAKGYCLAELIRIPIEDSPEGFPPPGFYIRFEQGIDAFENLSGLSLASLEQVDVGIPHVLAGRYRFEEDLQVVVEPLFAEFQQRMKTAISVGTSEGGPWRYKVCLDIDHFEDDLTAALRHSLRKDGTLTTRNYYYCDDLKEAFWKLLSEDLHGLSAELAFDQGLGYHIKTAFICDRLDSKILELVSLHDSDEIRNRRENGIYLKFHVPVSEFEQRAEMDLKIFDRPAKEVTPIQLFRYTAEGKALIALDSYKALCVAGNLKMEGEKPVMDRYREAGVFYLAVEWAERQIDPPSDKIVPLRSEPLQFMSQVAAFMVLLEVDSDLFINGIESGDGCVKFIQRAAVYDAMDDKPVWSMFPVHPHDINLPAGLYVRLHEDKITFESIGLTLQHFNVTAQAEGLCFMAVKPHVATVREQGMRTTQPGRQVRPPHKNGPNL